MSEKSNVVSLDRELLDPSQTPVSEGAFQRARQETAGIASQIAPAPAPSVDLDGQEPQGPEKNETYANIPAPGRRF